MHFSASLSGDQYPAQLSNSYLKIIRDFRDGVIRDLSGPWMFGEFEGICFLSHSIGGNQIRFSRRKADAPEQPKPDWTRETVNGKAVYRSSVPSPGSGSTLPAEVMEVVAIGDLPKYPDGALMLSVHISESSPAPMRHATLAVGASSWSLYRVELSFSRPGASANTLIDYYIGGERGANTLSDD
jgi:hypothetical protein